MTDVVMDGGYAVRRVASKPRFGRKVLSWRVLKDGAYVFSFRTKAEARAYVRKMLPKPEPRAKPVRKLPVPRVPEPDLFSCAQVQP